MGTTITLSTGTTTMVITGDGVFSGCTYDKFDGWYGIDNVDLGFVDRPNAPGSYAPVQTFPGDRVISIEGKFFGASRAAAIQMREDLSELYNDGKPVAVTVADDLRTTRRQVHVEAVTFPWTIHPEFEFSIDMSAADPRRYGETEVLTSTVLALPGTGLSWPIVWPVNWGTIGTDGRVTVSNPGNTPTLSRYVVSDGEMPDGFEIVNVETGERIPYLGPVVVGTVITIDSLTRTASINGSGQGSRYLSNPQFWTVPKKSSITLQFLARGPVTGSPRLDVYTAPAYY